MKKLNNFLSLITITCSLIICITNTNKTFAMEIGREYFKKELNKTIMKEFYEKDKKISDCVEKITKKESIANSDLTIIKESHENAFLGINDTQKAEKLSEIICSFYYVNAIVTSPRSRIDYSQLAMMQSTGNQLKNDLKARIDTLKKLKSITYNIEEKSIEEKKSISEKDVQSICSIIYIKAIEDSINIIDINNLIEKYLNKYFGSNNKDINELLYNLIIHTTNKSYYTNNPTHLDKVIDIIRIMIFAGANLSEQQLSECIKEINKTISKEEALKTSLNLEKQTSGNIQPKSFKIIKQNNTEQKSSESKSQIIYGKNEEQISNKNKKFIQKLEGLKNLLTGIKFFEKALNL